MKTFDAVLFDLDGVIVFTDKYHYRSWKALTDKMGWDYSEKLNHQLRGIPRKASLQVILDHNNIEPEEEKKHEYAAFKNDIYQDMLKHELNRDDMYPGVLDFLDSLRERELKLGLCSSSKNARLVIKKLAIENYFEAVVCGNDVERAKPHPQIFLLGAEKLGIAPDQCIVFEDAEAGIEAAHAAGMMAIGVGDEESVPNAKKRITSYNQINIDSMIKVS